MWNEFVVSDWRRAEEGRGSLALKNTERFERTFLAASSCKPFPITKFLIRPFSVLFLILVPVSYAAKANERPGAPKKKAKDLERKRLEVIMFSAPPLHGHPFTIRLPEVCWYEGVGVGLVLKYEDKETK